MIPNWGAIRSSIKDCEHCRKRREQLRRIMGLTPRKEEVYKPTDPDVSSTRSSNPKQGTEK